MGIINRGRADGSESAGTTVIAAGSKLVGDITISDHLHIDGEIEGTVRSESEVAVGQSGRVKGELTARHVLISGRFEGNVEAQRLEIVAGGRVDGDVTVSELVIESGALFNGNSRIRETGEAAIEAGNKSKASSGGARKEGAKDSGDGRPESAAKAG